MGDAQPDPPPSWRRASASAPSPTATGPLLVLGAAGTGKTELLARRLARLAADGVGPERVLVIGSTRATARRLRERAEALLERPLRGALDRQLGRRSASACCASTPRPPASTPSSTCSARPSGWRCCSTASTQLPLRRHEIRGNPAGLLARLLARIDALKADRVGPTSLAERVREREAARRGRPRGARRELEFAELYTAHDRILAEAGSLDRGDVFLALDCLFVERPDVRARRSPSASSR